MFSGSRLVTLWCPVCKKMAPHRVGPVGDPRCLTCEDHKGVQIPEPVIKPTVLQYPAR